jgi:hypothetical protein
MVMSSEFGIPTAPVKDIESPRRYFQLSMRTLMIVVTVAAAMIGCVVAAPLFAVLACLIYVGTSCVLAATLIYGKGWIKGFAIGFSVPHVMGYFVALNAFSRPEGVLVLFLVANAAGIVSGLTTSIAKSYLQRRGGLVGVPRIPFLCDWLSND